MANVRWTRRDFVKLGGVAGAALVVPGAWLTRPAQAATLLSGATYFDTYGFAQPLPLPARVDAARRPVLAASAVQFQQQVLVKGAYPETTLWGYRFPGLPPSWPGATIVARKGRRLNVLWQNSLPAGSGTLYESHLFPVDPNVHNVTLARQLPLGNLPVVTHLHGHHTESGSDGHPEAWFTQKMAQRGPEWQPIYRYDNDQEAGTLWYHDHVMGITRLNVYAGLAGLYLLRDDHELRLMDRQVLPGERHEIELAIQDRAFTDDGQLSMPLDAQNPPAGMAVSIFPDFVCVNGVPWPHLEVEPRKYRFRLLNGSDSRFLILRLSNGAPILRIGTELGLSDEAVELDRLFITPGERYDLVVDFSDFAGQSIVLENGGLDGTLRGFGTAVGVSPAVVTNNPRDTPWSLGGPSGPSSSRRTSKVMEFRVGTSRSRAPQAAVRAGTRLRPGGAPLPRLGQPTYTRKVVLLTGNDVVETSLGTQRSRVMELLGTLEDGTFGFMDPVTENPKLGAVEVWEIYNYTVPPRGLAHPIHIHLVHFQVVNREAFTVEGETAALVDKPMATHGGIVSMTGKHLPPDKVHLSGSPRPPEPHEQGWKDTVVSYPNEVTRVIAKFDRPGKYVWHCHILHHEDHDMMRPIFVGDMKAMLAQPTTGDSASLLCDPT